MSTIVYQGLQSCSTTTFESQIIQTTTLKLKVSTPSSLEFGRGPCMIANLEETLKEKCHKVTNKPSNANHNHQDFVGGWTFLQNLSNISSSSSLSQKDETIYVHPLSKKSTPFSRLSEKSLELCTESLGSETGTDIFSFSSSPTIENSSSSSSSSRTCNNKVVINKNIKKSYGKFPPPLTTRRGLNSVKFRPHREDGRLIIKAVETPLTHNYLQAERSNGRLRLCFKNFDSEMAIDDQEDEEMEEEETEQETEEEEEESDDVSMKRDIDGNNNNVEVEIGMEKCQWLSRCKESEGQSNKVFCDWRNNKPLWVATS